MMGRQDRDQRQLFYEFNLDEMIPPEHLLRRIDVFATAVLADLHDQLTPFYSDIGPTLGSSRADDPDAPGRLLLWHSSRAPAVSGSGAAPCLPLVLQARSRRQVFRTIRH